MTDALPHDSQVPIAAPSHDADAALGHAVADETPLVGSAALRIAVVGPVHPDDGPAAAHATMLAHHLADAGHEVTLLSWAHASRPREEAEPGPGARPGVPPFPRTIRALNRARPDSWLRAGRRLRDVDAILVLHVDPGLAPGHVALLRAAGAVPGGAGPRPQSVVVCLGELPVHGRSLDGRLVSLLLSRVDSVLVHDDGQRARALGLGAAHVSVAALPTGPDDLALPRASRPGPTRLLALGRIEGVEDVAVLLRAMASVPDITLTIAADLAGRERELVHRLAADPAVTGRVALRDGHVPADALAALLAGHDVLALPFRSAAATRDVLLGHAHGLPVLAPDVPPISAQVTDGVDGLLVPADDEDALAAALRRLGDPEVRRRLADGVHTPDLSGPWAHYLGAIEALSVDENALLGGGGDLSAETPDDETVEGETGPTDGSADAGESLHESVRVSPDGVRAALQGAARGRLRQARGTVGAGVRGTADLVTSTAAGRAVVAAGSQVAGRVAGRARRSVARAVASRRPLVTLRPDDLPDWVLATDVLGEPEQADDARRLSRILGLPRSLDSVSAWAALGTLAAVLRVRDDGRRSAVIVDEGGSRSLLSRWARAVGFAPVEIDFTGEHPSVAALDVDAGSLDVIVRIHPHGCDGDDVDHVLEQASWALRSGGLLVVTVPVGPRAAEGAVGPADVRGVLARAHDLGFVLVGDLDGDVNARMREAASRARADDAAYALVRLTLRRR